MFCEQSAAAQDVTSLIAAIEGIISQCEQRVTTSCLQNYLTFPLCLSVEQAGADIPRLGSLVVTLSGLSFILRRGLPKAPVLLN